MNSIWTKLLLFAPVLIVVILGVSEKALAQKARARQWQAKASPHGNAPAAATKVNPALQAYLTRVQGKLNKNWYLPDGNNHITLTVNVATDGNATDAVATGSPANQPAENAAMDAFNNSTPLEPLPSGVSAGKLILKFDSTADPHGDSHSNIAVRFEPNPTAPPATPPANTAPAQAPTQSAAPESVAPQSSIPQSARPAANEAPATSAPEAAAPETVPGTSIPTSAYASPTAAAAAASVAKAAASAPQAQGIPSNAPPKEAFPSYVQPSATQAPTNPAAAPADLLKSLP